MTRKHDNTNPTTTGKTCKNSWTEVGTSAQHLSCKYYQPQANREKIWAQIASFEAAFGRAMGDNSWRDKYAYLLDGWHASALLGLECGFGGESSDSWLRNENAKRIYENGMRRLGVSPYELEAAFANPSSELITFLIGVWFPGAPVDRIRNFEFPDEISDGKENYIAASVAPFSLGGKLTGNSKLSLSKRDGFSSAKDLFFTLGHELMHVSQYAALEGVDKSIRTKDFETMLDFHAYTFQWHIGDSNRGGFGPADARLYGGFPFWKFAYWSFSWTVPLR